jgi:molybdate transport system substrate-binding protein
MQGAWPELDRSATLRIVKLRMLPFAAALSLTIAASAQEPGIKVVATIAVEGALTAIEPQLAARAGAPVAVEFATTAALVERLANGEAADVAILTKEAVQQLAAQGYVRSSTDLVASLIGIAVADGAPLPAMQTTADFVAFMKATPSLAYTLRGVSGVHMARLIERLELTEVVLPKAVVVDGFAGAPLREGKVAAAVQQISELKFTGASNIVPLPEELQVRTIFTAAVLAGTPRAAPAAQVVQALSSAEAAAAYERSGAIPLFE